MKMYRPPGSRSLNDIVGINTGGPQGRRMGEPGHGYEDYSVFVDLIFKMLTYDPHQRITPSNACRHPFLAKQSSEDSQRIPHNSSSQPPPNPWSRREQNRPSSPKTHRV